MKKRYRSSFKTEGVKEEGGALLILMWGTELHFNFLYVVVVVILNVLGLFHMRAPFG